MNRGQITTIIGGLVLLIGVFLPWTLFESFAGMIPHYGYNEDGLYAGVIGIIIIILGLTNLNKKPSR